MRVNRGHNNSNTNTNTNHTNTNTNSNNTNTNHTNTNTSSLHVQPSPQHGQLTALPPPSPRHTSLRRSGRPKDTLVVESSASGSDIHSESSASLIGKTRTPVCVPVAGSGVEQLEKLGKLGKLGKLRPDIDTAERVSPRYAIHEYHPGLGLETHCPGGREILQGSQLCSRTDSDDGRQDSVWRLTSGDVSRAKCGDAAGGGGGGGVVAAAKSRPRLGSVWDVDGQRDTRCLPWNYQAHDLDGDLATDEPLSPGPHTQPHHHHQPSPLGKQQQQQQQQPGMSRWSVRRCRQWLGVGLPLSAFLYVLLYCHSSVWTPSAFSRHPHALPHALSRGSGFRKLLEDQERARQSMGVFNAGLTQRLPSCVIIGVRKCGTRALLEFLKLHPDVVTAEDEMHFFNDDERYRLGLEWYRHLMPLSLPHQITLEKTPGYFISPLAPTRLHHMNSSTKLLVLLRHPTTRTISDYTQIFHNKLAKNETMVDFEDLAVDRDTGAVNTRYKAVQISMYHQFFRRWMAVFPKDQIHVVDGDRLITDPVPEIRDIETFLGLQHRIDYSILYFNSTRGFYCMRLNATHEKCLGATKGRKHPSIQQSVIRKLNQFFQPHNQKLFRLLQRTFPWS